MTLQQIQYVVAVDKYRHFVKAAEACGVTQSTLSIMIRNLETELDAVIFDRSAHPVVPTEIGEKIIAQAKVILFNAEQLSDITGKEKNLAEGRLVLGTIPTVAPYLLPGLFREMKQYPRIEMRVFEARSAVILDRLHKAEIDIAVMATPLEDDTLLEIPLYYEKFYAYVSPEDKLWNSQEISPDSLPGTDLWVLQEGHCFRNQITNFCKLNRAHSLVYESGSIDTLIRVVDENGGHTIIPELHIPFLDDSQKENVRRISSPEPVREVSMVIRKDFLKERMLNIIADIVKRTVPDELLDSRLKKFSVRI